MSSLYLDGLASTKAETYWLRCFGVACIPCCCAGLLCFLSTANARSLLASSRTIMSFYGGGDPKRSRAGVEAMAASVRHEQALFDQAMDNVRHGVKSNEEQQVKSNEEQQVKIFPDVTLIECAMQADASGNLTRAVDSSNPSSNPRLVRKFMAAVDAATLADRALYTSALFAEYVRLGGRVDNVIHGYPEYVLLTQKNMAFTSDAFTQICRDFADPTTPLAQLARACRLL